MKKTYKIEVDCANCANLMEEATRKTPGVAAATVNFMTQKMNVEFEVYSLTIRFSFPHSACCLIMRHEPCGTWKILMSVNIEPARVRRHHE